MVNPSPGFYSDAVFYSSRLSDADARIASPNAPVDNFWMTPAMGQRMRFDFARSVMDMTAATENKRRAAEEAATKMLESIQPTAPAAPPPLPPDLMLPQGPPLRFVRY